jgi:hypothetical protein
VQPSSYTSSSSATAAGTVEAVATASQAQQVFDVIGDLFTGVSANVLVLPGDTYSSLDPTSAVSLQITRAFIGSDLNPALASTTIGTDTARAATITFPANAIAAGVTGGDISDGFADFRFTWTATDPFVAASSTQPGTPSLSPVVSYEITDSAGQRLTLSGGGSNGGSITLPCDRSLCPSSFTSATSRCVCRCYHWDSAALAWSDSVVTSTEIVNPVSGATTVRCNTSLLAAAHVAAFAQAQTIPSSNLGSSQPTVESEAFIIGVTIGCVVAAILIVGTVLYMRSKAQKRQVPVSHSSTLMPLHVSASAEHITSSAAAGVELASQPQLVLPPPDVVPPADAVVPIASVPPAAAPGASLAAVHDQYHHEPEVLPATHHAAPVSAAAPADAAAAPAAASHGGDVAPTLTAPDAPVAANQVDLVPAADPNADLVTASGNT